MPAAAAPNASEPLISAPAGSTLILTVPSVASSTAATQGMRPFAQPASLWSKAGWKTHSVTSSGGPSCASVPVADNVITPSDTTLVLNSLEYEYLVMSGFLP